MTTSASMLCKLLEGTWLVHSLLEVDLANQNLARLVTNDAGCMLGGLGCRTVLGVVLEHDLASLELTPGAISGLHIPADKIRMKHHDEQAQVRQLVLQMLHRCKDY